jgi:hypothetical protein
MATVSVRVRVTDKARRDAVAYFGEFGRSSGHEHEEWADEKWADMRGDISREFDVPAEVADRLWPVYWTVFKSEIDWLRQLAE